MADYLEVPDQWNNYFTKYPQGYTIIEAIMNWVNQANLMVDQVNGIDTAQQSNATNLTTLQATIDSLSDYVNGTLATDKVVNQLNTWLTDGTLDDMINEGLANTSVPKRVKFGGQLTNLKKALLDQLTQLTEIVFIGDSITWGELLPDNASTSPRDSTLSDARDNYVSKSWINEFKRYVMRTYATGNPTLSNWAASPTGQSTVELVNNKNLYPYSNPKFTLTQNNTGTSISDRTSVGSLMGGQTMFGGTSASSSSSVLFTMTGEQFTLYFSTVNQYCMDYQLYVNGVLQGTYSTASDAGNVVGNQNKRTHTFTYAKNAAIEIRFVYHLTGQMNYFYLEGIQIPKTIRIINQGIIGITSDKYITYNLKDNSFGDGIAISSKTAFTFVMLGTNDRIIRTGITQGTGAFYTNLKSLLTYITGDKILMCAPPAVNEDPTVYSFHMQDVRATIRQIAEEQTIDFIDNYILFDSLDMNNYTADGLHPNEVGHKMISKNIINSLEVE